MKKMGLYLLMICIVLGNVGFADDGGRSERGVSLADNQKVLFNLPIQDLYVSSIEDLDYNTGEEVLYVISGRTMTLDSGGYEGRQFTFDLDGHFVSDSDYPEMETTTRGQIEFVGNKAYSMEYDDGTGASYVYNLSDDLMLGEAGYSAWGGIDMAGNYIAYHLDKCSGLNFHIGTLDPYTASEGTVEIYTDIGRVAASGFSPGASEFIYSGYACSSSDMGDGLWIVRVSPETGDLIDQFTLELPEGITADDFEDVEWPRNAIRDLYATEDYIVVLYRIEDKDRGYIQRYTYDGELIDGVETDFCIKDMTEGPNNSTIYIQDSVDSGYVEVVQISWEDETRAGRPKSVISERSFGGKTIAEFRDAGFGLLKVVDSETGAVDYKAPLKSDKNDVRLRIPFADMQAKLEMGAKSLLINYQGQEIAIPMSAFDCADLLGGMPCQDDATVEILLTMDEAGNVKVVVQLFVVEQVNAMTRVVHRKTIQY